MMIGGIIVVVILAGGYLVAKNGMYGSATPTPQPQTQAQPTEAMTSPAAAADTSATTPQAITVEGNEFAFSPSTITAKMGQPITVTFKNTGKYPHNFTVADLNVQTKTIKTGEQDTVTFTPSKTGSFTYVCTVPGHEDKGMKGTLTVE